MTLTEHLLASGIIHKNQLERVEQWEVCGEVIVLNRMTEPQRLKVEEFLKCSTLHSHGTGCTIKCNNVYFGYFKLKLESI